jgi:hypothetical protein
MGNANSGRELSFELVMRIERLLKWNAATWVAGELGIDVGTVLKIRNGKHPKQQAWAEYVRCGECGGLAQMPCLLCSVRRAASCDRAADEAARE